MYTGSLICMVDYRIKNESLLLREINDMGSVTMSGQNKVVIF